MTSSKHLKYWRKMLKSLFGIYWILFAIFIAFKNMHVFKVFIFDFKNVHPILDFLTRRGKFISYFSDFYLFFYAIFSVEQFKKKYALARLGRGPAEARPARPRSPSSPRRRSPPGARSRRRLGLCPSPKPSSPPTYI